MDELVEQVAGAMGLSESVPEHGELVGTVAAVRVGRVRTYTRGSREFESGASKRLATGPVYLSVRGFAGDEQADLRYHGGPDKAVLMYAGHRYGEWAEQEGLGFIEGALFENVTLAPGAPDEDSVRMGEVWRLGEAVVQVTQPRSPCWKLAAFWGIKDLTVRVQQRGWTGWYLRVLREGFVAAGDSVERLAVLTRATFGFPQVLFRVFAGQVAVDNFFDVPRLWVEFGLWCLFVRQRAVPELLRCKLLSVGMAGM